jgi:hypothetical protein
MKALSIRIAPTRASSGSNKLLFLVNERANRNHVKQGCDVTQLDRHRWSRPHHGVINVVFMNITFYY